MIFVVIEHVFEQARESMLRHELEAVGKISIIAICSHRNARSDLSIELRWIDAPLFARVVPEEFLVQIAPDPAEHDLFGCARRRTWNRTSSEELFNLAFGQLSPYSRLIVSRLIGIGSSFPSTQASTRCSYARHAVKRDRYSNMSREFV